jgi:hypothetical protein
VAPDDDDDDAVADVDSNKSGTRAAESSMANESCVDVRGCDVIERKERIERV